jgi:hypothetical protein
MTSSPAARSPESNRTSPGTPDMRHTAGESDRWDLPVGREVSDSSGREGRSGRGSRGGPSDRGERSDRGGRSGGGLVVAAVLILLLGGGLGFAGWLVRTGRLLATPSSTVQPVATADDDATSGDVPASGLSTGATEGSASGAGAASGAGGSGAPMSTTVSPGASQAVTVDATATATRLTGLGIAVVGAPREAWQWTDGNGTNVLLLTVQVTGRRTDGGATDAATLRVVHAARLDTAPTVLRRLADAGSGPCTTDYGFDFTPGSVTVGDQDHDGVGEATVGWWERCRGDVGPATVKLGVLTRGDWFVLRGQGFVGPRPTTLDGALASASFAASPAAPAWPAGAYRSTVALFHRLYR